MQCQAEVAGLKTEVAGLQKDMEAVKAFVFSTSTTTTTTTTTMTTTKALTTTSTTTTALTKTQSLHVLLQWRTHSYVCVKEVEIR